MTNVELGPVFMPHAVDLVARTLLLPLLVAQALHVRSKALNLPEAAGARSGSSGTGPELRVLILGDSSAAGVGVQHQDQALSGQLVTTLASHFHINWRLEAQTGATTASTLARMADVQPHTCDAVVLALGVNDTTHGVPLRSWLRQQTRLLDQLETKYQARRIYVTGLPPMGQFPLLPHPLRWILGRQANRFDRHLQHLLGARSTCRYITIDMPLDTDLMAEDGFHPGPDVYHTWANTVALQIIQDFANPEHATDAKPAATQLAQ